MRPHSYNTYLQGHYIQTVEVTSHCICVHIHKAEALTGEERCKEHSVGGGGEDAILDVWHRLQGLDAS